MEPRSTSRSSDTAPSARRSPRCSARRPPRRRLRALQRDLSPAACGPHRPRDHAPAPGRRSGRAPRRRDGPPAGVPLVRRRRRGAADSRRRKRRRSRDGSPTTSSSSPSSSARSTNRAPMTASQCIAAGWPRAWSMTRTERRSPCAVMTRTSRGARADGRGPHGACPLGRGRRRCQLVRPGGERHRPSRPRLPGALARRRRGA